VRFTTAAALVNQLVEAQREQSLSRMLARWSRVELIVIDEFGYVPLAEPLPSCSSRSSPSEPRRPLS
jgi:DNA replication protein DnaC